MRSPVKILAVCAVALLMLGVLCPPKAEQPAQQVGNAAACGSCDELDPAQACEGGCTSCKVNVNFKLVPKCKSADDTDCCVGNQGGTILLPSGKTKKIDKPKGKNKANKALKKVIRAVAKDKGIDVKNQVKGIVDKMGKQTHCGFVRQGQATKYVVANKKTAYDFEKACEKAMEKPATELGDDHQKVVRGVYAAVGQFAPQSDHPRVFEGRCRMDPKSAPGPLTCRKALGASKASAKAPAEASADVPCDDLEDVKQYLSASAKSACGF